MFAIMRFSYVEFFSIYFTITRVKKIVRYIYPIYDVRFIEVPLYQVFELNVPQNWSYFNKRPTSN